MEVCYDIHPEIVHDEGRDCPICKLINEKDEEIRDLEVELTDLKSEIIELKEGE